MDLKRYLSLKKIKITHFAKTVGVNPDTLFKYLAGKRMPKLDLALKIQEKTEGRVTLQDLNDYWEKKKNGQRTN